MPVSVAASPIRQSLMVGRSVRVCPASAASTALSCAGVASSSILNRWSVCMLLLRACCFWSNHATQDGDLKLGTYGEIRAQKRPAFVGQGGPLGDHWGRISTSALSSKCLGFLILGQWLRRKASLVALKNHRSVSSRCFPWSRPEKCRPSFLRYHD